MVSRRDKHIFCLPSFVAGDVKFNLKITRNVGWKNGFRKHFRFLETLSQKCSRKKAGVSVRVDFQLSHETVYVGHPSSSQG